MDTKFSFQKGYGQLSRKDYLDFRKKLCARLGIAETSFYRRLTGEIEPKMSEGRIIEQVFGEYGITDVWDE